MTTENKLRRLKRLLQLVCKQKGQATVEYILMLSSVVVILSALLTAFHTTIVRWLFAFIGTLLTS